MDLPADLPKLIKADREKLMELARFRFERAQEETEQAMTAMEHGDFHGTKAHASAAQQHLGEATLCLLAIEVQHT